ncbi:Chloramphenicol acetyltransferase-like domain-containing protein [Cynara cardunculus var. scolymus]|uniref:Chloramphenicol acetyltransferase-like domain-containing protein n=1 Tax=Cynara cardunculus var. scolymus TaxID=59895 RepID=A0A103Y2S4_CYNCS|nr:Chloramphenicol acetyltransferase-like domain-containing protein [Cynara cardunculus var. scolymus]
MSKYSHLLTIGRSKVLSILNNKWVHESCLIRSYHPQPPFATLNHHHLHNSCSRVSTVSHYYHNHHHHSQLSTIHTLELPKHEGDSPLDYQVTVKDRDIISASCAPLHEYWLPQSNLDLLLPPLEAGVFFCYKKKDDTVMSPGTVVKTIKKSLGRVLSTFYPLAGEIVSNSQGEPEVLCNNCGVEFVHAHADVELKTLDLHHPDENVSGKLVPKINRGVTELKCGAIIVSCAFDHRVADGYSLNMFLVAWAEFSQFKQISITPSFRRSILDPRRPPRYNAIFDNMYLPLSSLPPPHPCEHQLHSRIYYIKKESLNRLQSEANSKETRISKFQSLTAFIWKLLAHQADNDVNRTSRMGVVVSGRRFLTGNSEKESSMLENHFGNILSIPYGEMNNCCLQMMPLNEVADKVHSFVTKATTEEHFRGLVDWVELHRPEPAVAKIYFKLHETDGEAIVASSGQGLPIKDMNFGWGKPEFGSYHFPWGGQTGYIITMPSASKNGDWVVYMHLKQKHLDLIEMNTPHIFNPLTYDYLSFH